MNDARKDAAEAIRQVKDDVRRRHAEEAETSPALPPAPAVTPAREPDVGEEPGAAPAPRPPDGGPVNEAWQALPSVPGGISGLAFRLLDRLLRPRFQAQQEFNARQVRLDNEILSYVDERSGTTHRHYDRLLGEQGRRLAEVDERHVALQKELVRHVDDLVRRIDVVLERGERGHLSHEHQLRELRRRLEEVSSSLTGS